MPVVKGTGNRKARILVLGEAPAANEVRLGYPFAGKAGEELNKIAASAGLDRERDFYITNSSLEPVVGNKDKFFFEPDGKPTQVLLRGMMALMEDIREIKPNVVVPLGNYALWVMMQHQKIMKWRGSILHSELFKVKTIPTIHPAALLWSHEEDGGSGMYKYRPVIIWDFERIAEQSQYPELRLRPRKLLVNPQGADREEALERIRNAKKLTFDCEAPRGRVGLKCISFSDYDPEWAACFWHDGTRASLDFFDGLLNNDIPKVGQNLMYDATLLDQMGVHVGNIVHDTMLAQHVILPDLPKGLDFQVSIYTDIPYYKDEGKEWKDKQVTPHDLMRYCCKDACGTTESAMDQEQTLAEDPGLLATFRRSMTIFDPLRQQTKEGHKVDRELLNLFIDETEAKRVHFQREVDRLAGESVNVMSTPQLRRILYEDRGLPPRYKGKTKDGERKLTTEAPVLMDLAAKTQDPLLVNVVRTRRARKLLSSYFNEEILSPDGRVRWEYKIAGTAFGRLSCQAPSWGPGLNGQTLPAARGATARRIIVPDDGHEFCEVDGMQAESVMTAVYAQDPIHLDCFRLGKDVHRVTACLLLDKDPEKWMDIPKDSKARELGKTCNHAFDYDMGPYVFMLTVNEEWDPDDPQSLRMDANTAELLRDKYISIRPALNGYWEWVRKQLWETRTLTNPFGRRYMFLDKLTNTVFKHAYSCLPQGSIGDYTNVAIIQVMHALSKTKLQVKLKAQTHDSALWMYPKEQRDEVVPLLLANSEVPLHINGMLFTVPVEALAGGSWYKIKPKDPPEWAGLRDAGKSRKTIELTPEEFGRMDDRMREALAVWTT